MKRRAEQLNALESILNNHSKILGYDKLLHEAISKLKAVVDGPETNAAGPNNEEVAALVKKIIEHSQDLAAQEQRFIDESPSAIDNRLDEEVHSYFSLAAQLKNFCEKYGVDFQKS